MGAFLSRQLIRLLEAVRLAPPGTTTVHDVLRLVAGGCRASGHLHPQLLLGGTETAALSALPRRRKRLAPVETLLGAERRNSPSCPSRSGRAS